MNNIGDAAFSRGDVMRRLHELDGLVRELVAGRRLEDATVGAGGLRIRGEGGVTLQEGGDLTVEDGGDIIIRGDGVLFMEDAEGQEIVFVGADVNGKQVFQLFREDGEPILVTQGSQKWGRDFWSLWDASGHIIVSDDAETGVGLSRPWLPVVMYRIFEPVLPESGSLGLSTIDIAELRSEALLWEGRASIQHPWITIDGSWGQITGTAGTVTTTYRLYISGDLIGEWTIGDPVTSQQGRFDVRDHFGEDFAVVEVKAVASGGADTDQVRAHILGCYLL